jgi:hypothetical protein
MDINQEEGQGVLPQDQNRRPNSLSAIIEKLITRDSVNACFSK